MKKAKKFLVLVCLGCVGYGLGKLLKTDEAQEKLFGILGEDLFLDRVLALIGVDAVQDKVYLLGDLLMWPIDFVRALLP